MEKFHKVSSSSLEQGKLYFSKGNFGRAFAHFLVAVKLAPALKEELRDIFTETLDKWGTELESKERFEDLFNCYEQAIAVFPENVLIYNNLGSILLRCGSPKEAADYFRKYVASDVENLQALRNLENACNLAVERWHYRMLNDQLRNLSFREAIVKKVKNGFRTVLDIGTGTGILSLFALEGGASEIYACDSSAAMTAIASEVFEHHSSTSIKLITKHSTDLKIPENLDQRVSLVVCEIVDCGLLGEHVLETLVHAWDHLLKPNGVVLPLAAALHICGIQSEDISQSWVLKNYLPDFGLDQYNILAKNESYDTDRLSKLPKGFTMLTEVLTALTIDFNDPEGMQDILEGKNDEVITLKVTSAGTLDCIAGWFTLRVDEDIALQTGPGSPISCWEQAIFPTFVSTKVNSGDELKVNFSCKSGKLSLKLNNKLVEEKMTLTVSQTIIKMLNNTKWVKALQSTADVYLSSRKTSVRILDLNPFPVFGLSVLKNPRPSDKLICSYSAPDDKNFIINAAKGIGLEGQVTCLSDDSIDEIIENEELFDVILLPVVEETGELNGRILSRLDAFRKCLKGNGWLLPRRLRTVGQIVESAWLQSVSQVIEADNTCGYDIAPFINKYSISHQIDFRLETIDVVARSEIFEVLDLYPSTCENSFLQEKTVQITSDGQANSVVYWHEIILLEDHPDTKITTTDDETHVNQAAQLISFNASQHVQLLVNYNEGMMGIRIKQKL